MLVISAGSLMHMLMAIVLLFTVYVDRWRDHAGRRRRDPPAWSKAARRRRPASRPTTSSLAIDGQTCRRCRRYRRARAGKPARRRRCSSRWCATDSRITVPVVIAANDDPDSPIFGKPLRRRDRAARHFVTDRALGSCRRRQRRDRSVPRVRGRSVKGVVKVLNPVNIVTHLAGTNDDLDHPADHAGRRHRCQRRRRRLRAASSASCTCWPCSTCSSACSTCSRCCRSTAATPRSRPTSGSASATGQRYHADVAKMMPFAMAVMTVLLFLFIAGALPRHHPASGVATMARRQLG